MQIQMLQRLLDEGLQNQEPIVMDHFWIKIVDEEQWEGGFKPYNDHYSHVLAKKVEKLIFLPIEYRALILFITSRVVTPDFRNQLEEAECMCEYDTRRRIVKLEVKFKSSQVDSVKNDKEEPQDVPKNLPIEAQGLTKSQLHGEVDLNNFLQVEQGNISYSDVGGLTEQIDKLREFAELPVVNPELFRRIGISPFNACLLFGPSGTGKTLLASALESQLDCAFVKVVSSEIVDKYIGESAKIIREMFNYARDHQPCIVFMDEIDAIGGRRFPKGTSADREIQRTLMELLNQLDRIDSLGTVKVIMATNRPDTLDPALLRPGRLDRKIEIGLPDEKSRLEILKIHSNKITKHGEIDFEAVVKLSDGFSGAHLKNVCTEAGMYAIRAGRERATNEDFMNAVREVGDALRLETKLDKKPV